MNNQLTAALATVLTAALLASCADAKENEPHNKPAPSSQELTTSVENEAASSPPSADPESDAVLESVRNLVLARDDGDVTLSTFDAWIRSKPDGYSRWGLQESVRGSLVMVMVNYTYDTGELADFGFIFGPIDGDAPLRLLAAYRGEQAMPRADAEGVLDGFVLDMYHQGLVEFR